MPSFLNRSITLLLRRRTVYVIYFLAINIMNIQSVIINRMNVWRLFRFSFFHLIHHKDIYDYGSFANETFDQFQYSPSFPVMFAPFSLLPYYVAYFLWNNLSMLLAAYIIYKIPRISESKKSIICYIALLELLTCLQGTQTNVMIAVLMILVFISFEKGSYWIAAFACAAGFYIKIYPIFAASLFLLYPHKVKFAGKLIAALLVLGTLPLLFISPHELIFLYHSWFAELMVDTSDNYGKISVVGLLQGWFDLPETGKLIIQLSGVFLVGLMYIRRKLFPEYFYRLYFLCVLLIWVVLFNHAAEIYGYSIAIFGVGLWFVHQKQSRWLNALMIFFIVIATVLSIDPTPRPIQMYIYQHSLKALPYCLMMLFMIWQMLSGNKDFFAAAREPAGLKPHCVNNEGSFLTGRREFEENKEKGGKPA